MIITFFGPVGVGKTTVLARYAFWEHIKKKFGKSQYREVLANLPCKHTKYFCKSDIGVKDTSGCLILWDEIAIDLNNRAYKDMKQNLIEHLKLHRHYKEDIYIFSQSYDDMDITLRRLSNRFYLLKRCTIWPHFVKALRITKTISIDEKTHEITDAYQFDHWLVRWLTTKRYYMPLYWHMFDSWTAPPLKKWEFTEKNESNKLDTKDLKSDKLDSKNGKA